MELPFMMGGAGLAPGAYGGVRSGLSKITKEITPSILKETYPKPYNWLTQINDNPKKLSKFEKKLANRIDKGNNELDSNFIKLAKENDIPLNAFNIYKDNSKPYRLSKKNPSNTPSTK
jgi:hypothetical protein